MVSFSSLQAAKPAFKLTVLLSLCAVYAAMSIGAWFAVVPAVVSAQTFAWVSALAMLTLIAAGATIVNARATRSIAHVLYDVEHPARLPKV
jgi:hypothetical protein